MKSESRRIIAMLLLFVTVTGLVMSFGESVLCAGEPPGFHETALSMFEHETAQTKDSDCCPCAPTPLHDSIDHFCTGDCGCPCQAPLSPSPMAVGYSLFFTYLYHAEPNRYIPEVYLSLFVPPDSATF